MNLLVISCFCLLGIVLLVSASPAPKYEYSKVKTFQDSARTSALNDERKQKIRNTHKGSHHFTRMKPQFSIHHVPVLKSQNQPHRYRQAKKSKDKNFKIKKLHKSKKWRRNSQVNEKKRDTFRRPIKRADLSDKLNTRRLGKKHNKPRGHKSQISGLKKFRPKKKYKGWTPKKTKPRQKHRKISQNEKMKLNEKKKPDLSQKKMEQQKTKHSPKRRVRNDRFKKTDLRKIKKGNGTTMTAKPWKTFKDTTRSTRISTTTTVPLTKPWELKTLKDDLNRIVHINKNGSVFVAGESFKNMKDYEEMVQREKIIIEEAEDIMKQRKARTFIEHGLTYCDRVINGICYKDEFTINCKDDYVDCLDGIILHGYYDHKTGKDGTGKPNTFKQTMSTTPVLKLTTVPDDYKFLFKIGGEPLYKEVVAQLGRGYDECNLRYLLDHDDAICDGIYDIGYDLPDIDYARAAQIRQKMEDGIFFSIFE